MADKKTETSNMSMIADAMMNIMDSGRQDRRASRSERSQKANGSSPSAAKPAVKPMTVGRPSTVIAEHPAKGQNPSQKAGAATEQRNATNSPFNTAKKAEAREAKRVEAKATSRKTKSPSNQTENSATSKRSRSASDVSSSRQPISNDLSRLSGRLHRALEQIREGKTSFSSPVVNTTLNPLPAAEFVSGLKPSLEHAPEMNPTEAAKHAQQTIDTGSSSSSSSSSRDVSSDVSLENSDTPLERPTENATEQKSAPKKTKTEAEFEKMRKQIHSALDKLTKDTAAKRKKLQDQLYQLETSTEQNIADLAAKLDSFWEDAQARQVASDERAAIDQEKLASTREFLSELNSPSPADIDK